MPSNAGVVASFRVEQPDSGWGDWTVLPLVSLETQTVYHWTPRGLEARPMQVRDGAPFIAGRWSDRPRSKAHRRWTAT